MAELGGVEIKGVSLRATLAFLAERGGDAAEALAKLPEDLRGALSKPVLASSYYPFEHLIALQDAVVRTLGGDRRSLLFELGRFAARDAMTTVYKIFLKVGSPEFILGKSGRIVSTYLRGPVGRLELVEREKGHVRMTMERFPGGHADFCRRLDGFNTALLELSGAKEIRLVHASCCYTGGQICEWVAYWKK